MHLAGSNGVNERQGVDTMKPSSCGVLGDQGNSSKKELMFSNMGMERTIDTPAQPLFRPSGKSTLAQRGGIDLEILDLVEMVGISLLLQNKLRNLTDSSRHLSRELM